MQRWMSGQNQRADTDKHDERRQQNTATIAHQGSMDRMARTNGFPIIANQSFDYKNRIIVTLSEYERGQDDVDDVEPGFACAAEA